MDASDFRDPFFFLKRDGKDSKEALKPGTTVDGLRFNTYNDSQGFVDRYYKNSNFVLKDVYGRIELVNKEAGCLNCHRGIEEISQNHKFACTKCHNGNPRGKTAAQAHKGLVSNPSDLKHAPKYCGKCHEEQIKKVKNSLMTTARGVIEITREAWGEPPLKQPRQKRKRAEAKQESTLELTTAPANRWTIFCRRNVCVATCNRRRRTVREITALRVAPPAT